LDKVDQLVQAMNEGNKTAECFLMVAYGRGHNIPKDVDQAVLLSSRLIEWLTEVAPNDPESRKYANYFLGICHQEGWTFTKNDTVQKNLMSD
jgi:hypothetical protein